VINDVSDIALQYFLFSITNLAGSTSSHLDSKSDISYAIQFLEPRFFNWSTGFLRNVKRENIQMQDWKTQKIWIRFFLGFIFLRVDTSDETTGWDDSMSRD